MSTRGRLGAIAGWALVLGSVAVALQLSGRGALASPPLADPARWAGWLDGRDPVVAAFALVRIAALAGLWYLVTVTAVGIVLRLAGAVRIVAVADRLTVAPVRRVLAGTVSLGLAASGVVAVAAPATRLPVAAAQAVTTPTTGTPPGTVTMHQLSPSEPVPAPASAPTHVTPTTTATSDHWTVAPGQCFWSIAETILTDHLGRAATDAEIVPYWRRLIEANRHELVHRDNPDLILPGQVFVVPAP